MSSFSDKVFNCVSNIPKGYVVTYGDIACAIGSPRASRQVGRALHNNPSPILIPCHKVVFKDGHLPEKFAFGGISTQKELLKQEGVQFTDDIHVDMKKCHYTGKLSNTTTN